MEPPVPAYAEVAIPACPVCSGHMEVVYDRHEKVVVCVDCHTGMTVPTRAWVVRMKKRLMRAIFDKQVI